MEKRHVEYILWDEEAKEILEQLITLNEQINKALDESHSVPFDNVEEFREKSKIASKINDKATPLVKKLESMFYVDEELDPFGSVSINFYQLPATADSLLSTIENERLKRHTRKRQPRIIKERAIELGLWDEKLNPPKVEDES